MTESEWLSCGDPSRLLEWLAVNAGYLQRKEYARKFRLLSAACCRQLWPLLVDEHSRHAVAVAERYADGLTAEPELEAAWKAAAALTGTCADCSATAAMPHLWMRPLSVARSAVEAATSAIAAAHLSAENPPRHQGGLCWLVHDIIGNPFRPPPTIDPAWLTGTVKQLAQAAYEERELPSGHLDRHRLAVLADSLEEAGCQDAGLLGHLRSEQVHVRGCWAVDCLLGKE